MLCSHSGWSVRSGTHSPATLTESQLAFKKDLQGVHIHESSLKSITVHLVFKSLKNARKHIALSQLSKMRQLTAETLLGPSLSNVTSFVHPRLCTEFLSHFLLVPENPGRQVLLIRFCRRVKLWCTVSSVGHQCRPVMVVLMASSCLTAKPMFFHL